MGVVLKSTTLTVAKVEAAFGSSSDVEVANSLEEKGEGAEEEAAEEETEPALSAEDFFLKDKIAGMVEGADLEALTWKKVRLLHAYWLHGTAHTNAASVD
jgi:hypothetical protein